MRAARVGLIAWLLAGRALAQETPAEPRELTVEALVAYARDQAARTRAARAELPVAEAEVAAAAVYPNPTLSYSLYGRVQGQSDAINGTQHQVTLEQPLLLGHDALRRDAARGAAEARRAEVDAAVFDIVIEARRRFVSLLAAQARLGLLRATRAELDAIADIVRGRASAGAQSAYDVARVELEAAQLDARAASADADVRERAAALSAWLGISGWTPVARGEFPSAAPAPSVARLWPEVLARSASLRAARRRAAAAGLDVRRAERERVPVPTLGLGAYVTTDGGSSSLYGSVSLPLPTWDTGSAQLRRAQAARAQAEANLDAAEREQRARLEGAVRVFEARRAALDTHAEGAMRGLPGLREMAEASYRSGASRVFDLLDAFRTRLAVQEQRVELVEQLEGARVEVDAATGAATP
ncbi:MAG: TolC family protein [Polyangiales bacterium]